MKSVTIPLHAQDRLVQHNTHTMELMIDYKKRLDKNGHESVHKVCIPSRHKGLATIAEKDDAAMPVVEDLPAEISINSEMPQEGHQEEPSVQDSNDVLRTVSDTIERNSQTDEYDFDWWTAFRAVNGIVSPSRLKPGQSPIKFPEGGQFTKNRYRNKCLICGDFFSCRDRLKTHFVDCVSRNGNPQGFYWNADLDREERLGCKKNAMRRRDLSARLNAVNGVVIPSLLKPGQPPIQSPCTKYLRKKAPKRRDLVGNNYCVICHVAFGTSAQLRNHFAPCVGRNGNPHGYYWTDSLKSRIGRETTGMHFEKDGVRDQHSEASTSEVISSDNHHISSYQSSKSCNTTQPSDPRSLASTPRLRYKCNDYTKAPTVARIDTDHGLGSAVIELADEETADMDIDTAQPQGSPSKQPRDLQARTPRLPHESVKSTWVISTSETDIRNDSEAIVASDHDSIHGDFDAIHTAPKIAVPSLTSHGRHMSKVPFSVLQPKDFSATRSPVPSSSTMMSSLNSPADPPDLKRYLLPKVLPSSATLDRQKRHLSSEPSPLFPSSKRRRLMPSQPADLLQPNTRAGPIGQSVKEGTQISQPPVERSVLNLSKNQLKSGQNKDGDHVAKRQAEAADLRINTEIVEGSAPPEPGEEPTSLEKLRTDFLETREDLREKIDDLANEVTHAKERAVVAERRVQEAENRAYQANMARFATLKQMEDRYKKESDSFKLRCDTLEKIIHRKNQAIDQQTYDLFLARTTTSVGK